MLLPGLDSDRFSSQNWIASASGSPYEFKIANTLAGAFRVDNTSIKGLRLSLSCYAGNSFKNTLAPAGDLSCDLLETKKPPVGRNRERNEKRNSIL